MGHGGGGALSAELMEQVFAPAYGNSTLAALTDSSVLELGGARLAFSTDSYVVRPLFFPGGCLGDLASFLAPIFDGRQIVKDGANFNNGLLDDASVNAE
ncbi:hypothetical protein ABZ629_36390, partial [Streptomyces sp. NPDC007110]